MQNWFRWPLVTYGQLKNFNLDWRSNFNKTNQMAPTFIGSNFIRYGDQQINNHVHNESSTGKYRFEKDILAELRKIDQSIPLEWMSVVGV